MILRISDNGVDRDMTAEEIDAYNKDVAKDAAEKAIYDKAIADKEAKRQAVYAKLGLTHDEIASLG
jgi:hypothetical protein